MTKLSLEPPVYRVGELRFSPLSGVLEVSDEKVVLRAREANLLNALIQSFPSVLGRADIEAQLWKDSYATNATINQTIKSLRFSLKDDERTIIRTIPKQGYVLSKKPIIEDETDQKEPVNETNNVQQDTISKHNKIYFFTATFVSILAFSIGVLGLGSQEHTQKSKKVGEAWYLMESIPKTLTEHVSREFDDDKIVVMRSGHNYRICHLDTEVMVCNELER